ncbi:hypothetical protein GIB67_019801 [Kingdonia uniflora]|uniref:RNase H type-1 domain-containing protein n=1 Tax=Kingdonia uniflora TaxID=39325 RepID=A0A7J7MK33_9MAGN|nr:hypothetical protein GIB67_019801 [Kingdonia uniflora]
MGRVLTAGKNHGFQIPDEGCPLMESRAERDSHGHASARAADSEEAEAIAVIRGLEAGLRLRLDRVLLLSDCQRLVRAFRDRSEDLSWGALTLAPDLRALAEHIVLRRKFNDEGEEIALSALLGPIEDDSVTRNVLMKVCVSKPKLRSLLQFDCVVYGKEAESGDGGSDFEVENAYYLPSLMCLGPEIYKGPSFR